MSAPIDPALSIADVHLRVNDLARQSAFYRERLGLVALAEERAHLVLGTGGRALLTLHEDREARRAPGTTGLYHFALLLPSRRELGNALARLASTGTSLTGVADHGVSEALYLDDAEGNGIELYRDRPREEWPRAQGKLRMTSDPLDLGALLSAADQDSERLQPLADGTVVGHVHLHVPHLEPAREFYCDTLGFDLMQRLGASAMFVSAGGYHHHLGFNTWLGIGAPPPPSGALGLERFRIRLGSRAALDDVRARLAAARVPIESEADGLSVMDPAAHRVTFESASR
jgi:catechol 2,3-dioxygenase